MKVRAFDGEEIPVGPLSWLLVGLIRVYQLLVSPFLGQVCRFHPSCSRYAVVCVARHGIFKGSWLAMVRLGKCHPLHPGGVDLPP